MQGTQVWSLVWKIPHAMWQLSPYATTIEEAHSPRACALQQEKPAQGEISTPQLERSTHSPSPQLQKSLHSDEDLMKPKVNK